MIAKLERAQSNAYPKRRPNTEPPRTMEGTLNNEPTTTEPPPYNGSVA